MHSAMVEQLLQILSDPTTDIDLKLEAIRSLKQEAPERAVEAAISLLSACLDDLYNVNGTLAWQVIDEMNGWWDERAIPVLVQALCTSTQDVPKAASSALIALGAPAVPALVERVQDGSCPMRPLVARTVGFIGDGRALESLEDVVRDTRSDPVLRQQAEEAIGRIGDTPNSAT